VSTPAQIRGVRKATRDLFQAILAVLAAGGATAVIGLVVETVAPSYSVMLAFAFKILIAYAQNYLETKGSIPTFLPTPGLITEAPGKVLTKTVGTVTEPLGQVVGTVETVATKAGEVVGTVSDIAGDVVGQVTNVADLLDPTEDPDKGMR
jgi:hypothetical protein